MKTCFDTFLEAVSRCADSDGILGGDFLVWPPVERWADYWCEPANVVTFACLGVDGVHYAIVKIGGEVREDSPVIHISPSDGEPYCVLGSSFLDYLADGCGVSEQTLAEVIEHERLGRQTLVPFLQAHFDHARLYDDARLERRAAYLKLVERPDGV